MGKLKIVTDAPRRPYTGVSQNMRGEKRHVLEDMEADRTVRVGVGRFNPDRRNLSRGVSDVPDRFSAHCLRHRTLEKEVNACKSSFGNPPERSAAFCAVCSGSGRMNGKTSIYLSALA